MLDKFLIIKFLKFCAIGFSGLIIDFGITWLFKEIAKTNKYIANSIGFVFAASSNYILNRIWTFESCNHHIAREYFSFFLIAFIGLGINNFIIWFLSDKIKLHFYLSKVIATGVVTLWNFGMNFMFTFATNI
jgi:putative flippase GtrA